MCVEPRKFICRDGEGESCEVQVEIGGVMYVLAGLI